MTTVAQVEGTHPLFAGTDEPIGVDETNTRWAIAYQGRNAVLTATFATGVSLEFKIPTTNQGNTKTGNVAAFTIPNFGNAQWVTYREHVKFEVRFPTPPKMQTVTMNVARLSADLVSDGAGGLNVLSNGVKVGALPQPWIEYTPDGTETRERVWLDWVVAEPSMSLVLPTLSASEWATAVLDPTVITTSTASTATAYSNQRKIDRTSNGVLWAMYWDGTSNTTDSMHFRYSTDDGATWSDGGGFGFASTGSTFIPNGSLFIDADDFAHVAYKDRAGGAVLYRRGVPNVSRTAWTWSAAHSLYTQTVGDMPDVVAHREGTGWRAWVTHSYLSGSTSHAMLWPVSIGSDGAVTVGAREWLTANYATGNHTHPSIDFNHTGDGKTVAGSTPHLYVAWSAGGTGSGKGIRFKKATYSGGSWTWGTEREIDSTSHANAGRISSIFDGTRAIIAYADSASTSSIKMRERDAADTTTTTRTPTALSDGVVSGVSVSYDDTNGIRLGAIGTTSADVKHVAYDRTGNTWGAWTAVAASAQPDTLSLQRGYADSDVGMVYTDGTGSPYSVTYEPIVLVVPPNMGTATPGGYNYTGAATGTKPSKGGATGSVTWTGSATGTAPREGAAAGSITWTGTASGVMPMKGSATGTVHWAGSTSGGSIPAGEATGTFTFTGTATGITDRSGSATGTVEWRGVAGGNQAAGGWSFTGTAVGSRPAAGIATGYITWAGTAAGAVTIYLFTPPVRQEGVSGDRLFSRYTMPTGMSVVRIDGQFKTHPYPWMGELEGLTSGVDYFLGGRTYTITDVVALELEAAGYDVDILIGA